MPPTQLAKLVLVIATTVRTLGEAGELTMPMVPTQKQAMPRATIAELFCLLLVRSSGYLLLLPSLAEYVNIDVPAEICIAVLPARSMAPSLLSHP